MLHPLFSTIIQRPDLVVDHLSAYGALIRHEATKIGIELLVRVAAWITALIAGIIFLIFAGIAFMLGFSNQEFHWVLIIVPGVLLAVSVIAVLIARKPLPNEHFPELKAQVENDAEALRTSV